MIKMKAIALDQESIPLIVQLVENPKWDIPGIEIFDGSTDLETHDFIHLLIGRGVLPTIVFQRKIFKFIATQCALDIFQIASH